MKNKIYIIPTVDKPIKVVFHDRYNIEEAENGFIISETVSLRDAINRVKAAGNDPNTFINALIKNGKWDGMIV